MEQPKLKDSVNYRIFLIVTCVIAFLLSAASIPLFFLIAPFSAVAFAILFLYAKRESLAVCISVPLAIVFATAFLSFANALIVAVPVLVGLLIAIGFRKGTPKYETAIFTSLLFAALLLIPLYVGAVTMTGDPSVASISVYLSDFFADFRGMYLEQLESVAVTVVSDPTEAAAVIENAATMIDTAYRLLFGYGGALCLIYSGITFKVFAAFVRKLDETDERINRYHFSMPMSFAVFYTILFVLDFFAGMSATPSTFSLIVMNLNLVFFVMFAYFGVRISLFMLARRNRAVPIVLIVVFILFAPVFLMLVPYFLKIVSLYGVFVTFLMNRIARGGGPEQNP